jgi:hypothetical protein
MAIAAGRIDFAYQSHHNHLKLQMYHCQGRIGTDETDVVKAGF